MKKEYITPMLIKGLSMESGLIMSSLKSDDGEINMNINSTSASGDAESRRGSFWDDSE